jgi:Tfp pilus assembly protein PilN
MVRINLLSEHEKKKSKGRGAPAGARPALSRPSMPSVPLPLLGGVLLLLLLGGAVFLYVGQNRELAVLAERIDIAQQDSTRYARAIARIRGIESSQSAIVARIQAIQSVDQGRFRWAHTLEEISRALPDNTWLTSVTRGDDLSGPDQLEITGVTFSNLTLTRFMTGLELSPYFENVSLVGSTRSSVDGVDVTSFALLASYTQPASS